jgi:hypothetical protein
VRFSCNRLAKAATAAAVLAAAATAGATTDDARAFCSTEVNINACPDGTDGHEAMSDQALGFLNDGARLEINEQHYWMDTWTLTAGVNHFDNCRFQESVAEINEQYTAPMDWGAGGVLAEFDPNDPSPLDAAGEFGQMLHIAQDFYSHSNWIELGRDDLFDAGTGGWTVADDWQLLRDDIVVTSKNLPAGWKILGKSLGVPRFTTADGSTVRGLESGLNEHTFDDDCLDMLGPTHGDEDDGLNKDRNVPTKPLWALAYALAKRQTTHEWCRLLHMLDGKYGAAGPATAMGLWLANDGSPHPQGTPCAPAPSGPVKVTAKASKVTIKEDTDDFDAEINTRLILFGRDLRQTVRSQAPRITGVDEEQDVPAPPPVSFCVDATDELAVTVQGWDDDDELDGSGGTPGHFDAVDLDNDDALAGITKELGQASDAEGTYIVTSDDTDIDATFEVEVSEDDTDQDGLTDCEETDTHKTNPENPDSDNDGLNDGAEVNEHKTNPNNPDTDNDGLGDGPEIEAGSDPKDADSDNDGLNDGPEVNEHGTNPNNPDSDNDGLNDGPEVNEHGTNPNNPDSDDDGLNDGPEVNEHGTNPNNPDSDDDGLMDGIEVEHGTDPNNADSDGDGLLDGSDVEFVQNAVAALPAGDFKPQADGAQEAIASILDSVEKLLLTGDTENAVTKLHNLRKHVDGCGSDPDNNDWIVACESQTEVRSLVDTLITNLGG